MRKIFLSKNDDVAEVVEKIISEPDSEIILVIPKNALIEGSVSNFHLLYREAKAASKNILIESVDEGILALAKASHIEATHPLFRKKQRQSSISDIVPAGEEEDREEAPRTNFPKTRKKEQAEAIDIEAKLKKRTLSINWFSKTKILILAAIAVIVVVGFWITGLFTHAEISINFKKLPWQFNNNIIASTAINKIDLSSNVVPAELLTQDKNTSQSFPASGRANVNEKATGKLIIYNAYSSSPQPLVVNTRFLTPDGKLFRLTNSVTVPGAQVKDGKIIPSTLETNVIADKAGTGYNLGPIERLSIPGFKGSPKYQAFYGSLVKTSGGFIGEKAVPTDKDIASAKTKISETLKSSLENDFLNDRPKDFKIIEGASEVKISKLTVNKITDEKGNFTIIGEAKFNAIGFREEDLKSYFLGLAAKDNPGMVFKDLKMGYTQPKVDFGKGELRFSVSAVGSLTQDFSADEFKNQTLGKKISEVRSLVLRLPGLSEAKVSVWPSWVGKIPKNPEKTKITVQ